MKTTQWLQLAALASAIGMTGTVAAADTGQMKSDGMATPSAAHRMAANNGMTNNGMTNNGMTNDGMTSPLGQTPETAGVGGNDKSPNQDLDLWMNDYATSHNGRITRQEFLDQMGNRWDRIDAQRQGYLTPDQARGVYGRGQAIRPARTGSDVTPGYTGPGASTGK